MEAVDDGLTDIVKFLLEAGADPNIADEVFMTLLFFFAFYLV
jgi:ankyrin repeat protein